MNKPLRPISHAGCEDEGRASVTVALPWSMVKRQKLHQSRLLEVLGAPELYLQSTSLLKLLRACPQHNVRSNVVG